MEDLINPGAKKLLKQLDNPDKYMSRLPPLPLPEWSNIRKRKGMLIEKMVSKEGHVVMPEKVVTDLSRFSVCFEESVNLSEKMLYSSDLRIDRQRWDMFTEAERIMDQERIVDNNKGKDNMESLTDDLADLFDSPIMNSSFPGGGDQDYPRCKSQRSVPFLSFLGN